MTSFARLINGPSMETFTVEGPLLCPYFNRWGESVYRQSRPFTHNPFTLPASSTSGSPLVLDEQGRLFGFTRPDPQENCIFCYDGNGILSVTIPEGQTLYVDTHSGDADLSWRGYNSYVLGELGEPASGKSSPEAWARVEYCTWVEQKRVCNGAAPQDMLNDDWVAGLAHRLRDLDLPIGKFTIDHGWECGHTDYGDWLPDVNRFPDFPGTLAHLQDLGYLPGLWMAPIWIHPASCLAQRYPEFIGEPVVGCNADSPMVMEWNYLNPEAPIEDILYGVFARLYADGVRKFKFDMIYARKDLMRALHERIYKVVKAISPDVEVEIHQPDIFFSRHADTIRTNDVLCVPPYDWKRLTLDHFRICQWSAPDKIINMDHPGGNDPEVSTADFLDHVRLYDGRLGYPALSLIGDPPEPERISALRELCNQYNKLRLV